MGKKNVGSPVEEAVEAIPPEPSSNGQAPPPEPDPEPRRPAQEFRLGSTVAVIWENETQLGKRYSVQFFRLFKNDQGQWNRTNSFNRDQLPAVGKLAEMAWLWVFGTQQSEDLNF